MGKKVNEAVGETQSKEYFTGLDIANKVGLGDFYKKGEKMLNNKTTKTIGESKLREMVREAITNIISEGYDTVQWRHFDNNREDNEMIEDAIEALQMSDGAIDFFEWYGAYQDEVEPDYAEMLWKKALKKYESMF
jgi:Golgi nucleoside diphosphatase